MAPEGRYELHNDRKPLRRARYTGVEPAGAAVLEGKALVEQDDVIPLRALRFVHREHVAVVELVVGVSLHQGDLLDPAFKAIAANRNFRHLVAELYVRGEPQADDARLRS